METLVENFSKRNDFNSLLDLFIHLDEVGEFLIHKQIFFLEGEREKRRNRIFANFGRKFFRIIKYNFDFLLVKKIYWEENIQEDDIKDDSKKYCFVLYFCRMHHQ